MRPKEVELYIISQKKPKDLRKGSKEDKFQH